MPGTNPVTTDQRRTGIPVGDKAIQSCHLFMLLNRILAHSQGKSSVGAFRQRPETAGAADENAGRNWQKTRSDL